MAKLTARGDIYGVTAKAKYLQKKGDPFDVLNVSPERIQKVHTRTLTGPQLGMLKRNGVDVSSLNNHQQVTLHNEMIRRLKANLCTYKQAKILKKYGYGTNVSFKQATQTITKIANNGWRRPD